HRRHVVAADDRRRIDDVLEHRMSGVALRRRELGRGGVGRRRKPDERNGGQGGGEQRAHGESSLERVAARYCPRGARQATTPCPSARYSALCISSRRLTVRWNSKVPSPDG